MTNQTKKYDPGALELARQEAWSKRRAFETAVPIQGQRGVYVKPSSPFTSGNLHMGHVRDYAIGDAYARFRRARGDAVLFGFGFDAFGLPAELAAIERREPPADWVERSGERMLAQMVRLGFSFDYDRVFYSSDEDQYRWSQWLFLTLLGADLIYRADATVDWCDHCQTTLAALQVEGGRCWRCHNEVRLIRRPTWFLRIVPYLEENDLNLDQLENWDELSLATQRYILGRSDGYELDLEGPDRLALTVFTPHGDFVTAASFVMLSPRHPEIERWMNGPAQHSELDELRSGGWERSARDASSVPVIDSGTAVIGPAGSSLPVFVSPLVDARYGPFAVLGIPAIDEADATIAQRMGLIATEPPGLPELPRICARRGDIGPLTSRFRASATGVRRSQSSTASNAESFRFHQSSCRSACRETLSQPERAIRSPIATISSMSVAPFAADRHDARPTLSIAISMRFGFGYRQPYPHRSGRGGCSPHPDLRCWLPSERLVAGADSGGFVFDQRVITKALRDIGPLSFLDDGEPFSGCLFHEMVIAGGRKMSKHLGNVVDPDQLVELYGADTVRLAVLYAAGPAKTLNWNDGAIRYARRFLLALWEYAQARFAAAKDASPDAEAALDTEFLRERLQKWCANGVARITSDLEDLQMHSAIRNVTRLFERIKDFEKRVLERRGALCQEDLDALRSALVLLIKCLAPFAPHLAEELLIAAGGEDGPELLGPWPEPPKILPEKKVETKLPPIASLGFGK